MGVTISWQPQVSRVLFIWPTWRRVEKVLRVLKATTEMSFTLSSFICSRTAERNTAGVPLRVKFCIHKRIGTWLASGRLSESFFHCDIWKGSCIEKEHYKLSGILEILQALCTSPRCKWASKAHEMQKTTCLLALATLHRHDTGRAEKQSALSFLRNTNT